MTPNDFWCRAFLAAMRNGDDVDDCEGSADTALAVAQRRGMVTGELEASAIEFAQLPGSDLWKVTGGPEDLIGVEVLAGRDTYPLSGCRTLRVTWSGARVQGRLEARPVEASIDRSLAVAIAADREVPEPKLERLEFTAERRGAPGSGLWALRTAMYTDELVVADGDKPFTLTDGNRVHIKWGESMPPKPIELWIERAVAAK